jgi:hypothetical protein
MEGSNLMRVKQIKDIDGFFKALDQCRGRVELITDERDVLNLASKLTQFIGLTRVFNDSDIKEYEIVCYDAGYYEIIKDFLVPVK